MTAHTNQTTGLTNGRVAHWAPEIAFIPFQALAQLTSCSVAKSAYYLQGVEGTVHLLC